MAGPSLQPHQLGIFTYKPRNDLQQTSSRTVHCLETGFVSNVIRTGKEGEGSQEKAHMPSVHQHPSPTPKRVHCSPQDPWQGLLQAQKRPNVQLLGKEGEKQVRSTKKFSFSIYITILCSGEPVLLEQMTSVGLVTNMIWPLIARPFKDRAKPSAFKDTDHSQPIETDTFFATFLFLN